MGSAVIR